MAFDGNGVFVRLYNWVNDASANIKIRADRMDNEMNGFATGLSTCITKDGQTTITADLPMAGYRHTNVGVGNARTQYTRLDQSQDGKLNWADGGGTSDAITATYSPAITALVDGQECYVRATAANTTTTPTFSPNSLTARTIVKNGNVALVVGDIAGDGHELHLRYRLSDTKWELLNPATATTSVTSGNVTGTVAIANGGTGQTSKTPAFDALSPLTTKGDLIVYNGTNNVRVGVGANGSVLVADSAQASGVKWDSAVTPSCKVYQTTGTSIPTATWTEVLFDTEEWDTSGWHSTSVNTGRMTLDFTGRVTITFLWDSNSTTLRTSGIRIKKNGTVIAEVNDRRSDDTTFSNVKYGITAQTSVSPTDYITVEVNQQTGGSLTTGAGLSGTQFTVSKI